MPYIRSGRIATHLSRRPADAMTFCGTKELSFEKIGENTIRIQMASLWYVFARELSVYSHRHTNSRKICIFGACSPCARRYSALSTLVVNQIHCHIFCI